MAALVLQFVVLLAEVLFLLQQGDVAPRQFLFINPQHRQRAQSFAQVSSDFIWVLLKGVEQLLMGEMSKGSNKTDLTVFWEKFTSKYGKYSEAMLDLMKTPNVNIFTQY